MHAAVVRSQSALLGAVGGHAAPRGLAIAIERTLEHTDVTGSTLHGSLTRADWARAIPRLAEDFAAEHAGADVVHALDVVSAAVALSARRLTGSPVVVRAQAARPTGAAGTAAQQLWPVVLRGADAVVVPTVEEGGVAEALGAARERVVVCPDGALVAAQVCAGTPLSDADPTGVTDGPAYVLGLSGVPAERSVRSELLRTLVVRPQLRLVLASPDDSDLPLRNRLLAQARACGVLERVVLPGRVPDAEVVQLVDGARVVVATRSDPTCALAALVAMHRSRPVVAVRSAAAAEVLVDGVTGLVTEGPHALSAALTRVSGDEFCALAWGVAGRDRATSRYAPDLVGRSLLQAYERAAA